MDRFQRVGWDILFGSIVVIITAGMLSGCVPVQAGSHAMVDDDVPVQFVTVGDGTKSVFVSEPPQAEPPQNPPHHKLGQYAIFFTNGMCAGCVDLDPWMQRIWTEIRSKGNFTVGTEWDNNVQIVDPTTVEPYASNPEIDGEKIVIPSLHVFTDGKRTAVWNYQDLKASNSMDVSKMVNGTFTAAKSSEAGRSTGMSASYPLNNGSVKINGRTPTRSQLIKHLQGGEHGGKFAAGWLESLSYQELDSLHYDDHGFGGSRVKWQHIPQYSTEPQRVTVQPTTPWNNGYTIQTSNGYCPTGMCPWN